MKTLTRFLLLTAACLGWFSLAQLSEAQTNAAAKKLLVVTITKGYRHASITIGEKVVGELAQKDGSFTVDYVRTDEEMKSKMTADALKNYDGVFFLCTTGELPLPDKAAFLEWIKSGKAFIGAHSATDTFHGPGPGVDPYIDMIGGEFVNHIETAVVCNIEDPNHPSTKHLGKTWPLTDEIYFHKNFSRDKVHMLISLDKMPGSGQAAYVPISWCKKYGQGNVFFSALGHEDKVWASQEFQKHLLGGIRWAFGLEKGDATPSGGAGK
jgi:type 1 glutamine amidotransferase